MNITSFSVTDIHCPFRSSWKLRLVDMRVIILTVTHYFTFVTGGQCFLIVLIPTLKMKFSMEVKEKWLEKDLRCNFVDYLTVPRNYIHK